MATTNNNDNDNDGEKNIRLHEEKSDERGGGERHYGLPQQKERKSLST
jgi:hypothetical protein